MVVVQFDMNPLVMTTDFMLFASLNPLEIIYDAVSYTGPYLACGAEIYEHCTYLVFLFI